MFNMRNQIYFTLFFALFASLASALPRQLPNLIPPRQSPRPSCPSRIGPRESNHRVFLGYTGITGNDRLRQFQREPIASLGGELGAVLYIADAVDLAGLFAHGPRPAEDYICLIYADADEWSRVPKTWVDFEQTRQGSSHMNRVAPGAVLFDVHTPAGLPHGAPYSVHQMGIRQQQIRRLRVTATCYAKTCYNGDHHTLDYPSLTHVWDIQPPPSARGPLTKKSVPNPKMVLGVAKVISKLEKKLKKL